MKRNSVPLVTVVHNGKPLKLTRKKYEQYKSQGLGDEKIAEFLSVQRAGKSMPNNSFQTPVNIPQNNFVEAKKIDYIEHDSMTKTDEINPHKLVKVIKPTNLSDKKPGAAKRQKRKIRKNLNDFDCGSQLSDSPLKRFFLDDPLIKWLSKILG